MNKTLGQDDTICAIATPTGIGSIGVIRISGRLAISCVQQIFRRHGLDKRSPISLAPSGLALSLSAVASHTMHHGQIIDPSNDQAVDDALFVVMKGPRSYTGEDVVEIQSHGNPHLQKRILSMLVACGARLATPGEFTRRAYLAGKMDLAQAEAVMALIAAQSDAAQAMALHQLRGKLSHKIATLRDGVLDVLSHIEGSIDFSEQGIDTYKQEEMLARIGKEYQSVCDLLEGYEEGKQIREGTSVVIIGRPNVGKSSILNLLLGEDRAIVTPIPGTTRDTLEEGLNLEGHLIKIIDTAGFRDTTDPIEKEGVRRGEAALKRGDIALFILDASEPIRDEDIALGDKIVGKKVIVLNKIDLPLGIDIEAIRTTYPTVPVVLLSAITGEGFPKLKNQLVALIVPDGEKDPPLVALLRHKNALERAKHGMKRGLQLVQENGSVEFLAADLREALDALGEIVGETTTDDILDQIFNQFCIGK